MRNSTADESEHDEASLTAHAVKRVRRRRNAAGPRATRERILDAALDRFLVDGDAAKIEDVMRGAKVSRQTVYNHFPTREALFKAVVERAVEQSTAGSFSMPPGQSLRAVLHDVARSYVDRNLTRESLEFARVSIDAARRYPELGSAILDAGPRRSILALARHLRGHPEIRHLRGLDPLAIAESFFAALIGHARFRYYYGKGIPSARQREAYIRQVVDLYVRGLGLDETPRRP